MFNWRNRTAVGTPQVLDIYNVKNSIKTASPDLPHDRNNPLLVDTNAADTILIVYNMSVNTQILYVDHNEPIVHTKSGIINVNLVFSNLPAQYYYITGILPPSIGAAGIGDKVKVSCSHAGLKYMILDRG